MNIKILNYIEKSLKEQCPIFESFDSNKQEYIIIMVYYDILMISDTILLEDYFVSLQFQDLFESLESKIVFYSEVEYIERILSENNL